MTTTLKRSKDRKVANSLTPSGNVRIANSFGLPAGREYSCPSATAICEKVCYAGKLEKLYKGVREALTHNWDILKAADAESIDTMVDLLDAMITDFETECIKWNAPMKFRIHWDGDFFSDNYALAWRLVIARHPDVQFWVYTRVESAALVLNGLKNLSLYFSGDVYNKDGVKRMQQAGIRIAMLGQTFEDALVQLEDRGAKCPEQRGQIALNGACVECGICVKGNVNMTFSISKK